MFAKGEKTHGMQPTAPLLAALFDILYGYCHQYRVMLGQHNVESAWAICKLSPSLSWLEARVDACIRIAGLRVWRHNIPDSCRAGVTLAGVGGCAGNACRVPPPRRHLPALLPLG